MKSLARRMVLRHPALGAMRINRLVFGNALPLNTNMRYLSYLWRCRRAYGERAGSGLPVAIQAAVRKLRSDGYCIMDRRADPSLTAKLAADVDRLVAAGKTFVTPGVEEWMIEICESVRNVPEIFRLFQPEVVASLEAFYGSNFKIYSAEVYRLTPTDEAPQLSGLWHTDNYPPGFMKAMVYLTDCDLNAGALKVHPLKSTRQLLTRGFFDRNRTGKFVNRLEQGWVPLEGSAGTIILWNPNVVHCATPPKAGVRDAVAFKFLPSLDPWDRHLARIGEALSLERRVQTSDNPSLD